jgi:hypothetical protein
LKDQKENGESASMVMTSTAKHAIRFSIRKKPVELSAGRIGYLDGAKLGVV